MTKDQLKHFRQKLFAIQEALTALDEEFTKSADTVKLDQSSVGRLSRMDAMQAQQMALEAARRRQLQTQKIAGALRRIQSDDYGYCFVCEEEIDVRRLEADPTNTRCLQCADKE